MREAVGRMEGERSDSFSDCPGWAEGAGQHPFSALMVNIMASLLVGPLGLDSRCDLSLQGDSEKGQRSGHTPCSLSFPQMNLSCLFWI